METIQATVNTRLLSKANRLFTGTLEGIEQLTKPLGILHLRVAAEDGAGAYLVDHTASVLLFDPDGRYHAVFGPPLSADAIASDFRKMLKAYQ